MELARRFGAMPNRQGRRIVFMTFSAEERGLLGSRHYCNKEPLFPLDKTVAMVNLDMVGRLQGRQGQQGGQARRRRARHRQGLREARSTSSTNRLGFQLNKKQGGYRPQRSRFVLSARRFPCSFLQRHPRGISHAEGHVDLINVPGMKRIADLAEKVVAQLASDPERPAFASLSVGPDAPAPKGKDARRPRLGISLEYEDTMAKNGVKVEGVSAEGVAAAAGIKEGDIIVELAGKQVKNSTSYIAILANQKIGQTIEIGVLREGKKITLKAALK